VWILYCVFVVIITGYILEVDGGQVN